MKISFLVASAAASGEYQRCFEDGNFVSQGFKEDNLPKIGAAGQSTFEVSNGEVRCRGDRCQVICDDGYHFYGGHEFARCRRIWWGPQPWDHQFMNELAECKTCDDFNTDASDVHAEELYRKWGSSIKRIMKITCPGYPKKMTAIKPINKTKIQAVCKCISWPKDRMDKGGKCHWRIGSKIVDEPSLSTYYGNWYCQTPPQKEEEDNKEVAEEPPVFRIPPNLVCKQQQKQEQPWSPLNDERIIGGVTAIKNSWPWIVNINFFGYNCGGTIIDDKTVITAAHCCKDRMDTPEFISITIGDHHRWKYDLGEKKISADEVIVHPEYKQVGLVNDICILKFNRNGAVNLKLHNGAPACLPEAGSMPAHGTRCWSAGWGLVNHPAGFKSLPQELQEVDLQIYSDAECAKTRNSGYVRSDEHICAGWPQGGKDGCQGDSGGPLICADKDNQPVVVGVTSWGFGCAEPNSPGVWTKVSAFLDWIVPHMN